MIVALTRYHRVGLNRRLPGNLPLAQPASEDAGWPHVAYVQFAVLRIHEPTNLSPPFRGLAGSIHFSQKVALLSFLSALSSQLMPPDSSGAVANTQELNLMSDLGRGGV